MADDNPSAIKGNGKTCYMIIVWLLPDSSGWYLEITTG